MGPTAWTITTSPDALTEGLFGQVVLWAFEILPFLHRKGIFPGWDVKSRMYGAEPGFTVIPGVFDLAYAPPEGCCEPIDLLRLRDTHIRVLGGGHWDYLSGLWHTYFRVPARTLAAADTIGLSAGSLGIHYRGTDKNRSPWDTNPVTRGDFLTLVEDFLGRQPEFTSVLVATDEFEFVDEARRRLGGRTIVNLGEVGFFKEKKGDGAAKADRALLDCVLLSRCRTVLKCSSALSAFAKVLNPALACFRVSASKLLRDVPYFPEAYIPRLASPDPECRRILERQFVGDWIENPRARARFGRPFRTLPRYRRSKRIRKWLTSLVSRAP